MKITIRSTNYGTDGVIIDIKDEIHKLTDLDLKCSAVFGKICQTFPSHAKTVIIKEFELGDNFGFIMLTLPEHQGAHSHDLVLVGNWKNWPEEVPFVPDDLDSGEYSPERHAKEANYWFGQMGIDCHITPERYRLYGLK